MSERLEFHKGIDYAVVMRPSEGTDDALCRLYGEDRHVTKYGKMFAASPDLLAALKDLMAHSHIADSASEDKDAEDHAAERAARHAIAKAEGKQP